MHFIETHILWLAYLNAICVYRDEIYIPFHFLTFFSYFILRCTVQNGFMNDFLQIISLQNLPLNYVLH